MENEKVAYYLIFAGAFYYPNADGGDFRDAFPTEEEAMRWVEEYGGYDWVTIKLFDGKTMSIVWQS